MNTGKIINSKLSVKIEKTSTYCSSRITGQRSSRRETKMGGDHAMRIPNDCPNKTAVYHVMSRTALDGFPLEAFDPS